MPKPPKKTEEEHKNPLLEDTRASFAPAAGWATPTPEVEEEPTPIATPQVQPEPVSQPTQPAQAQEDAPLLYKSQRSADWLTRPYIDQYDKQNLSADPYLIGAVEAGCVLLRLSKTEAFNEMMEDWLKKHADVLEARPDVVRVKEEKYRKKHRL